MKSKISITIENSLLGEVDKVIDNLYIRNRSQAIEHLIQNSLGEDKIAVILAGGKEESLAINGKFTIDVMIKGKTILEHAINKLRASGFKNIFIVARAKILTKAFEILKDGTNFGVKVEYIEEKISKGTATTLKCIKGKVNTRFLAVYADIVFNNINIDKLWEAHMKQKPIATLMLTTSSKPYEKGSIIMEGDRILSFIQKSKESDIHLVFSPIFAAEPEILDYPGDSLERNVFSKISDKGLLRGYLSSEKEVHIHDKEDVKKVKI